MRFLYPVKLTRDADGRIVATFPGVPGAVTDGADRAEALHEAEDCLITALGAYVATRRDLPRPGRPKRGQPIVALPPLISAKLALYQAMRGAGLSNVALARRLKVTEAAVRRLLDLDHRSHIGQVEAALAQLGKRLLVEVRDAA